MTALSAAQFWQLVTEALQEPQPEKKCALVNALYDQSLSRSFHRIGGFSNRQCRTRIVGIPSKSRLVAQKMCRNDLLPPTKVTPPLCTPLPILNLMLLI